jgi:hypothetical protein
MKKLLITIVVLITFHNFSKGQINLASGAGSTTGVPQSFNETRGVDITILSSTNINVQSVTLHGFFSGLLGQDTAYVGVRIYNSSTAALLASTPYDTVYNIAGGDVTIPFVYTLISGNTYRFSFFCGGPNPPTHNSAYLFLPISFPYIENSGSLQIVHAYAYPADVFPSNTNMGVPLITINSLLAGMDDITKIENEITIAPNPATDKLQITNTSQSGIQIVICSALGKNIYKSEGVTKQMIADVSKLPKGLYFVSIVSNQDVITKKIILQ